jgi:hypothetical protein
MGHARGFRGNGIPGGLLKAKRSESGERRNVLYQKVKTAKAVARQRRETQNLYLAH